MVVRHAETTDPSFPTFRPRQLSGIALTLNSCMILPSNGGFSSVWYFVYIRLCLMEVLNSVGEGEL